jgi:hypothetical protein
VWSHLRQIPEIAPTVLYQIRNHRSIGIGQYVWNVQDAAILKNFVWVRGSRALVLAEDTRKYLMGIPGPMIWLSIAAGTSASQGNPNGFPLFLS